MHSVRRTLALAALAFAGIVPVILPAQSSSGVVGYWKEPGGSVLNIAPCGDAVCATLAKISKDAPGTVDGHNPDPKLKDRPLCGLTIGTGFHLDGPDKADDGKLYDPKTGKTYQGAMRSEGDVLHLRGYIGMKAFGRSEDWARTTAPDACTQQ